VLTPKKPLFPRLAGKLGKLIKTHFFPRLAGKLGKLIKMFVFILNSSFLLSKMRYSYTVFFTKEMPILFAWPAIL
jgi:hypothetical protein